MSDSRNRESSIVVRVTALALGLLLIPLTFTPQGLQENQACGSEGPDGNCVEYTGWLCKADGEWVQNWRFVE